MLNMDIKKTNAFQLGHIEIQDEGSQIIAFLCDTKSDMRVIDFCAGAGGKTLAIAAIMKNKGEILACDTSLKRLKKMKPRLKRAGIINVTTKMISSIKADWIEKNIIAADRVLCDVPCTSSGTWRRHPEKKWFLKKQNLDMYCHAQRQILHNASLLVRPGGHLIYSTCSILPEENEEQIIWFLKNFKNFKVVPMSKIFNKFFNNPPQNLTESIRLSPALFQTDGFFCTVLKNIC